MNIALTCSIKPNNLPPEEEENYLECDSPQSIKDLADAIAANGHNVEIMDVSEHSNIELHLNSKRNDIDLVFNVAEGVSGPDREAVVPNICEILGIPYTAASPSTCIDTLDKDRSKQRLKQYHIPTPKSQIFHTGNEKITLNTYPLIIKPTLEGSSKGIFNDSLVHNEHELLRIVNRVISQYKQPAIAEEFMPGREFTVALIGYKNPIILPIVEITFNHLPKGLNHIDSHESKWIYDNPTNGQDSLICPAKIDDKLQSKIEEIALATFKAFDCRDWARMDIRLNIDSLPNVLDINALPGFVKDPMHNSRLPRAAYAAKWTYEYLIGQVIKSARERYDI